MLPTPKQAVLLLLYVQGRAQEPLAGSAVLWSLGGAQLSITHLKQFCVQKSLLVIVGRGTQLQRDGFWFIFFLPIRMI